MNKSLLLVLLSVGIVFSRGYDPQRKYNELYEIVELENENKKQDYARSNPEKTYVWKILSPKAFPDCNGEVSAKTIYGLFFSLGGVQYGVQVINKETYEEDGYIEAQVLILTFMQANIGENHPDKHYRAHRYRYNLDDEEWIYEGVVVYVKTWEVQVNKEFAGYKGKIWETRGVCPGQNKGDVSGDLWRRTKKFFNF